MWATEVAEAQLELLRIRAVRADLMAKVDLASGNLEELQRLASLDRDERFAHSKRRRYRATLMVIVDRIVLSERTQFCSIASTAAAHCAEAIAETATRHP
jgi:hypothetical protein